MTDLITVFRMTELSARTRANIIIKLGQAKNYQYSSNFTEPIVVELVTLLDPEHPILKEEHYLKYNPPSSRGKG